MQSRYFRDKFDEEVQEDTLSSALFREELRAKMRKKKKNNPIISVSPLVPSVLNANTELRCEIKIVL